MGITENDIKKLFNIEKSFSNTVPKNGSGSGIGLLLCKEFFNNHNSEPNVKSELGKGSSFSFTLPLTKS